MNRRGGGRPQFFRRILGVGFLLSSFTDFAWGAIDLKTAERMIKEQQFPEALSIAAELFEKNPNDPGVLRALGMIYKGLKDFDRGLLFLEKAIKANPQDWVTMASLGGLLFERRDLKGSLFWFKKAIIINPKNPKIKQRIEEIEKELASAPRTLRRMEGSLAPLPLAEETENNEKPPTVKAETTIAEGTPSLSADTDFLDKPGGHSYIRASELYNSGKGREALKELEKACADNPNEAEFFRMRGVMATDIAATLSPGEEQTTLRREAQDALRAAVRLNPNGSAILHALGTLHLDNQNIDGAMNAFTQALEKEDNIHRHKCFYGRGIANLMNRTYWDAIDDFSQAINLDPNYALAYKNRGMARLAAGEEADGKADLQKFEKLKAQSK